MVPLMVATAGALAVTLVLALVVVLVFAFQTGAFIAQTAAALELVDQRARHLAERLERVQLLTHAAAADLAENET
jgi:hypothetical protein